MQQFGVILNSNPAEIAESAPSRKTEIDGLKDRP
jgi:hypothetical protein